MVWPHRIPLPVCLIAWAAGALGWSTLTGDNLLLSAFAVLGAFYLVLVSVSSAIRLGARRAAATVAIASSLGPWVALVAPEVTVPLALTVSVSAVYLALYLRVELPDLRRGFLVSLGLKPAPPDPGE